MVGIACSARATRPSEKRIVAVVQQEQELARKTEANLHHGGRSFYFNSPVAMLQGAVSRFLRRNGSQLVRGDGQCLSKACSHGNKPHKRNRGLANEVPKAVIGGTIEVHDLQIS